MTPLTAKQTTSIPSVPNDNPLVKEKQSLYTLYYRAGNNPHAMTKNFFFPGTIREVVDRAKEHCVNMGIRFVRVQPFISDLKSEERQHSGIGQDENANG